MESGLIPKNCKLLLVNGKVSSSVFRSQRNNKKYRLFSIFLVGVNSNFQSFPVLFWERHFASEPLNYNNHSYLAQLRKFEYKRTSTDTCLVFFL